ncbi:hypothetical protein AYI68_g883 [Smittium mucronatum]|uniref:Ribophorin II n=1 Tax=Smittium mucronatum TaxID=133383 RepID=A0A1R0H6V0_9FUNG|nr:hypothetical protein AYI68_g883 [Smittium mucronatum]
MIFSFVIKSLLLFSLASICFCSEIVPKKLVLSLVDKLGDVVLEDRPVFPNKLDKKFELESKSKLSIEFEAFNGNEASERILLNQATFVLTSIDKKEQVSLSSKFVKSKNKYKATLSKSKFGRFLTRNGQYTIDLVLGSYQVQKGVVYELGTLDLNCFPSEDNASTVVYGSKPEIKYTFPVPQKMINPIVSIAYTALLALPFLWYFIMLGNVKFPASKKKSFSFYDLAFFGCILSYSSLITSYFIGVKIFPVLFYGLILAVPTLIFAQKSLHK